MSRHAEEICIRHGNTRLRGHHRSRYKIGPGWSQKILPFGSPLNKILTSPSETGCGEVLRFCATSTHFLSKITSDAEVWSLRDFSKVCDVNTFFGRNYYQKYFRPLFSHAGIGCSDSVFSRCLIRFGLSVMSNAPVSLGKHWEKMGMNEWVSGANWKEWCA